MFQRKKIIIFPLFACGSLIAGETPRLRPETTVTLEYREKELPEVHTRLRYTTVFVLPKSEKIMDFVCGDKENWVINGADNFAYIKPQREKARTNLNLVTASGNVYSFLVSEGDTQPDLKVFVEPKEETMLAALTATPKWVPASEVDSLKEQARAANEESRKATEAAVKSATEQVDAFRTAYPGKLKHVYRYTDRGPFQLSAIAHDDRFTYIWANPQETPVLYEIKDGKPNLISFEFRNGLYVVNKILDAGYLAVGNHRLDFKREE
ncbi:MAG TPA: TrbG/VirB9 family P-type conjugative transfer protein [Bryobacteraceae bacterium]|nr:TrbG/VirB9 family P-type conjugative transfer protein [Bryobacteraceae bacterium]